jgi:hypothetical protein
MKETRVETLTIQLLPLCSYFDIVSRGRTIGIPLDNQYSTSRRRKTRHDQE